jgi:hypothetical protein
VPQQRAPDTETLPLVLDQQRHLGAAEGMDRVSDDVAQSDDAAVLGSRDEAERIAHLTVEHQDRRWASAGAVPVEQRLRRAAAVHQRDAGQVVRQGAAHRQRGAVDRQQPGRPDGRRRVVAEHVLTI